VIEAETMTTPRSTTSCSQKEKECNTKQSGTGTTNNKLQRVAQKLLFVPYFLGIIWTCLHPVVSVLTGEAKCRGWFLDEHSIETRFTDGKQPLEVPAYLNRRREIRSSSLCGNIDPQAHSGNLICHTHGDYFEMAMIAPLSNALDATEEAIVVVLPSAVNASSTNMHKALIQSIENLADPVATPWLAKTLLVVMPVSSSTKSESWSLEETVSFFLDAYLGQQHESNRETFGAPPLPPNLSKAIIRQIVVIDAIDTSSTIQQGQPNNIKQKTLSGKTHLAILPQGRRGVLPNADLVFLVSKLLERTSFMNARLYPNTGSTFLTHSCTAESIHSFEVIDGIVNNNLLKDFVRQSDPKTINKIKTWANDMVNMALFARTLAVGPTPPHAKALDRGIDSLTIQVSFDGTFRRDPSVELMQNVMEYLVRALGNLHERLHHSFTLYLLLTTPKKFVSHMEYFLPNILLLLPLAVRAFGLLLPAMGRSNGSDGNTVGNVFDLATLRGALLVSLITVAVMALVTPYSDNVQIMTFSLLVLYMTVAVFWMKQVVYSKPDSKTHDVTTSISTHQFVSCVLAAHILAPIAFAHTSLAYLPSLLWVPLLAFPNYANIRKNCGAGLKTILLRLSLAALLLGTSPLVLVSCLFSVHTPFVRFAYVPLHLYFFLLYLMSCWL